MQTKKRNILIVDDHDLVLKGLRFIIEDNIPSVQICSAKTGSSALELMESMTFDLVILDIGLPDIGGFEMIELIRKKMPEIKIITNTMHDDLWHIRKMINYDVEGILLKTIDSQKIREAINIVLDGGRYYCQEVQEIESRAQKSDFQEYNITQRELDVLKLVAEGKITSDIAKALCLSTNTVDTHRKHLMEKMNAKNTAELIVKAISLGFIPINR